MLYVGTALALLVFPLTLVARVISASVASAVGDLLLGGALYLFAVGEFVHSFISMRTREWRAMWQRGQRAPARLRHELRRAEAAARRGAGVDRASLPGHAWYHIAR